MEEKRNMRNVAARIGRFFRENRRMPSYGEMTDLLGVRSKSVVHFWIRKLVEAGVVEKDNAGRLIPTRRLFAIPAVGAVHAGLPAPEEETVGDLVSLDEYLIERPDSSFLLQVTGDSMTGAGIMDADWVVVERDRPAKGGDIVVAEVDGEWTLKYLRREGNDFYLEAANPAYGPIRPQAGLRLGGVVTAVIRKYHP
ncbi:MAG TPA: transcriptional repressor LexA [Syntrophales bacterium]|nr:transcriptional repressor LexA [Syntrophales bacterium]HOM07968.1 transcriptional repressor LexA [Syntrophales bacterium]HPQ06646.1 transcriptional repressor LexA [Syntrophales bacterium]